MWPFKYPYSNFHELNLDWILSEMKKLDSDIEGKNITFADPIEWSEEREYPAYCIVTYENNAFLSRQSVPSGTSIFNNAYWQKIADSNVAIDAAVRNIAAFDTRHIFCVGDSYSNGTGIGDGWPDLIAAHFPDALIESARNNAGGFVSTGVLEANFPSIVLQAEERGMVTNPEDVTLVVCIGGVNDGNVFAPIFNGVQQFITNCKSVFPNAKIIIGFNPTPKVWTLNAIHAVKSATLTGAYYIDNSEIFSLNAGDAYKGGDEIHLNTEGYKNMARMISEYINKGTASFHISYSVVSYNGLTCALLFDENGINFKVGGTVEQPDIYFKNLPFSMSTAGTGRIMFTTYVTRNSNNQIVNSNVIMPNREFIFDGGLQQGDVLTESFNFIPYVALYM